MPIPFFVDQVKKELMKYFMFLFGVLLSSNALAAPSLPAIPQSQHLAALDYFKEGEQTGCGLRITAETGDNLWINALVSVFLRESGALFGMFKLDIKKLSMKNGEPLIQDGKVMYSSIGKIRKGWIKTGTGIQLLAIKGGESPHGDGYMAQVEFENAVDLLVAIPQTNFSIGFSKEDGYEGAFEFSRRITQDEAGKLSSCMKRLRDAKEGKIERSF